MRVELIPMVAKHKTALGLYEKPLHQNMVMVGTGKKDKLIHMAYICDADGSPFNALHEFRILPQPMKDEIVKLTMEELGKPRILPPIVEPTPPQQFDPEDFE